MQLMSLQDVYLSYGESTLLNNSTLSIDTNQRICLIGRNGAGKSSLLKIINNELLPDAGKIIKKPSITVAKLEQDIPTNLTGSIHSIVTSGLTKATQLLKRYEQLLEREDINDNPKLLTEMEKLQHQIEHIDAWNLETTIRTVLSKMALDGDASVTNLSGGMIRRVLLAKALVAKPDILLLDEPTNHLDIATIEWLEEFLLSYNKTIIFITHDRQLLQKIATKIVELDNGMLQEWNCSYDKYLERKAMQLDAEQKAAELFDKRLSEEEKWIRKGIQARRTRNEGRVRHLKQMRRDKEQQQKRPEKIKLKQHKISYSGKAVFGLHKINFKYNNKSIIDQFSMKIIRGDKIAIIGKNGCGKSTFLKLLLNELEPDSGKITVGTQLQISYFDQRKEQLDEQKTVIGNLLESGEYIDINGKSQHVISYLQDFLFTPDRVRMPIKALSGGERHRLLLARIFMKPSNLLILDEPTNDLDIETLELLEERLLDYQGTLLIVSHDRAFVNNLVTSTLVFNDQGKLENYVGNYDDYQRQKPEVEISTSTKLAKESNAKSFRRKK